MTNDQVEAVEPWAERWLIGQTGWDTGQPHSQLERLIRHARLEGGLKDGASLFSAGCGRAHNEAWLAEQGYQVDAVDVVPKAIAEARSLYGERSGLHLQVSDIFADSSVKTYDAAFDRAMLCAINPSNRVAYVHKISEKLRPGGLLLGLLFRRTRTPEGPPFAVDEEAALALFGESFDLCFASPCPPPEQARNVLEEWMCIWRKRSL